MTIDNPCHGCNERSAACHTRCQKYDGYRARMDKRNEEIQKNRVQYNDKYSWLGSKTRRRNKG